MQNQIVSAAKLLSLVAAALPVLILPAYAQEAGPSENGTIGGKASAVVHERCVDVDIGGSRSFNCLNQELKRQAEQTNPTMNIAPIDARSPDIQVGVVNVPAVQQQYGQNFGRSVVPYRPPPPIFTSPLVSHR
jgi:hypothetical protein